MAEWQKRVSEYKERLVAINRITKVVKGGRRFGFAALVVVGNEKGSIGVGSGKSKQVPDAIKKATQDATRNLIKISLKGIWINFLLAISLAFLIASGTCFAFA